MEITAGLVVVVAGVIGGVIAGMIGGGSIITFPAMLEIGLPSTVATASNIVALTLSNMSGVFADPKKLPNWNRSFKRLVLWALLGSAIRRAPLGGNRHSNFCVFQKDHAMGRSTN
jgi:uncharacterized membrane protein YfcA